MESLTAKLSTKVKYQQFRVWLVGDTPLITNAWSEKAKRQMLGTQVGAIKAGKEKRDPEADFVSSLYEMTPGVYGFPVTGIKKCILSAAHKDKGIPKTEVLASLWVNGEMTRVRPALAGAICDMPLIRIWGSEPEMREDMVKVGKGLNKTASLAYRAQFTVWAFCLTGRFDPATLKEEALGFLIEQAGNRAGLGEWRNERSGVFGAFHMADATEEKDWEAFAAGKGPLPVPSYYKMAAE